MPIKLLAIDIDGTLVNSQDQLTPRTREAVQRALDNGIHVVLATGRRYSRVLSLVESLGLTVPVVTASGALIKHPADHRTLYCASFAPPLLRATLQIVADAGFEAVLYADTYHEGFDFYCHRLNVSQAELADYFAWNPDCHREWPNLMQSPPAGVFAGFAIGSRAAMLEIHQALQAALPGQLYTHVLRSPRYVGHMCEIAPHNVTKWTGIMQLAEAWGVLPTEICAVGDDVNDLPMIEGAALGIAMGNALDEVKAAAQRIAPSHDDDGMVQVVDWVLAENRCA